MSDIILTYEGFFLVESGRQWKSLIEDQWLRFDTAGQWKQYIDKFVKRK